jgi:hypothetical protein
MEALKALLSLMFEPEDEICVSDCKGAYHSMPQATVFNGEVPLVHPNQNKPIRKVKTSNLTMLCINAIKGWRRDEFVTSHRTFLWEIDVGSLASQMQYMQNIGLPYSASIFSGNKSIHFITVLDESIDAKTWRMLNVWGLSIGTLFDQNPDDHTLDNNCKNPSRSVRIPAAIRPDTGKEQKLIELKSRVKLDDFMAYLNKYPHLRPKEREERKGLTSQKDYDRLSSWCRSQFKDGIDFSNGRNKTFFALGCDLAKSGYSENETIEILEQYFVEEHDFKYKEFLTAIKSAFTYMANKI